MHILENYFYKNFNYKFINKFKYQSLVKLPTRFKKIILTFNTKTADLKNLVLSLLALEMVTLKKLNSFIFIKKPNLIFKVKKGTPIGCKIVLKKKPMFLFLKNFFFDVLPLFNKQIDLKLNKKTIFVIIKNISLFSKLSHFYLILKNKNILNFNIVLENNNFKQEILFSLKLLNYSEKIAFVTQR